MSRTWNGLPARLRYRKRRYAAEARHVLRAPLAVRVETTDGDVVWRGREGRSSGGASRLTVNGPRGEILIPLAVDICVEIDVANRKSGLIHPGKGVEGE